MFLIFFHLSLYVLDFVIVLDKHREYMAKVNVLKFYFAINSEAGIFPSLFLIFSVFEPRCSYKIVLIKKECVPPV